MGGSRPRVVIGIATTAIMLAQGALASAQEAEPSLRHVLSARPITTPIVLDGHVSPEEWGSADVATDFIQYQPQLGSPATQPTDVLFLYDDETLYVAFRVSDVAPPTAQLMRRDDDVMQDDSVVVVLDTFHDRQSAYIFGVNPLGTIADGRIANDGRTIDLTWDGTRR